MRGYICKDCGYEPDDDELARGTCPVCFGDRMSNKEKLIRFLQTAPVGTYVRLMKAPQDRYGCYIMDAPGFEVARFAVTAVDRAGNRTYSATANNHTIIQRWLQGGYLKLEPKDIASAVTNVARPSDGIRFEVYSGPTDSELSCERIIEQAS